jgi:hypothetical protein
MSSCPKSSDEEVIKEDREREIVEKSSVFLRSVVLNLCALEGVSGHIDRAFSINRPKILAKVLRDLAKELEDSHEK